MTVKTPINYRKMIPDLNKTHPEEKLSFSKINKSKPNRDSYHKPVQSTYPSPVLVK